MGYMEKLAAMGTLPGQPAPEPAPQPEAAFEKPESAEVPATLTPPIADKPPEAAPAITLDAGVPAAGPGDAEEAARRRAHEAEEAKRKAEWEARRQAKRTAAQAELDHIAAMSDDEIIAASVGRVGADTEKLTRRNMKEAVCEHIQDLCRQDLAFARKAIQPGKSMINCFKYINRQAQAYAEQEMKDNGIARTGVYGLDVPDGLCFQWAVDYFNDPDAQEDHEGEEKFVPRPYVGKSGSKPAKPKEPKKPAKAEVKSKAGVSGQMSLL